MKLAYGNYGMPDTPYAAMARDVAEIGYDAVELCVAPGYPTAPDQLETAARSELAQCLQDAELDVASFMVAKINVLETDAGKHRAHLDYLQRVLQLRNALGVSAEISSTLGGQVDDWSSMRDTLASCVTDWADAAGEAGAYFAFEPHVGGIINSPERALWLLETLHHPYLRVNFDYSHFELLDIPLSDAVDQLLPYAAGIHVKDVRGRPPDFRFLLPGEGSVDYAHYLQLLQKAGYTGYVTVEISGQIFGAQGYDALAAARASYAALAEAFQAAGIARA